MCQRYDTQLSITKLTHPDLPDHLLPNLFTIIGIIGPSTSSSQSGSNLKHTFEKFVSTTDGKTGFQLLKAILLRHETSWKSPKKLKISARTPLYSKRFEFLNTQLRIKTLIRPTTSFNTRFPKRAALEPPKSTAHNFRPNFNRPAVASNENKLSANNSDEPTAIQNFDDEPVKSPSTGHALAQELPIQPPSPSPPQPSTFPPQEPPSSRPPSPILLSLRVPPRPDYRLQHLMGRTEPLQKIALFVFIAMCLQGRQMGWQTRQMLYKNPWTLLPLKDNPMRSELFFDGIKLIGIQMEIFGTELISAVHKVCVYGCKRDGIRQWIRGNTFA